MHSELTVSTKRRLKRKVRVRKTLRGTATKPRLCVNRSSNHIYAQVIDDESGTTLAGIGTYNKELRTAGNGKTRSEKAAMLGEKVAAKLKELNIGALIFDRGAHKYHGVIAQLANAVREAGIQV